MRRRVRRLGITRLGWAVVLVWLLVLVVIPFLGERRPTRLAASGGSRAVPA